MDWNLPSNKHQDSQVSRIFYRCVDWNVSNMSGSRSRCSRIFYRCVDWNSTFLLAFCEKYFKSHLLQMRGLKLPSNRWTCTIIKSRIFYRCVDWNITSWRAGSYSLSHPLQMRGLKHRYLKNQWRSLCRIFYRCVDWNLQARKEIDLSPVASFTDAWIETLTLIWYISPRRVASFTDAWIETTLAARP